MTGLRFPTAIILRKSSLFAGCGTDSGKENSASDTSKTKEAGTTISVAAIETAYGSEMWQKVADAFTEETGIKVEECIKITCCRICK